MQTTKETIERLHGALSDYIEATYHISSEALIRQRKELLCQDGVIHRIPYLESTPRYKTGDPFASMTDLPDAALKAYSALAKADGGLPRLVYDPPYSHQSEAIRGSLIDGKNLVIMTGTGSGKTESFLLPILGKLACEAESSPASFRDQPAMRALLLYPMNALVNDQLGRLRALFGDPRIVALFKKWAGRPPRFARYTSRTPYAGVRTRKKDSAKLQAFDDFYADIQRRADDGEVDAAELLKALKARGKWPAKPDLAAWFGEKGSAWQDRKTGEFVRAITLPDDSELLTRHEVQTAPPDLLVTNYSMLEYMLMRPIERTIFDQTQAWLAANPDEKFLVVLDEAHLYRGAAGAEVGLLLRRLRDRLGLPVERFQIICATASFQDRNYAPEFGSQLSGVPEHTFIPITGTLDLSAHGAHGSDADASALMSVNLSAFFEAEDDNEKRFAAIKPLLTYRSVSGQSDPETALHEALVSFPPMALLVNATMSQAIPLAELSSKVFPNTQRREADAALTVLMALGSIARPAPGLPGLLPCRIHSFFRGLSGLWVCMDPACTKLEEGSGSGICGKMYSQPIEKCGCGARVLELYTCRNCGTAYARAYTDDVDSPSALWSKPGQAIRLTGGESEPLLPIDLLLEQPAHEELAELADYDLETGRLNPNRLGSRTRSVYIRNDRVSDAVDEEDEADTSFESRGLFIPCAVCRKTARGRSYVQDHQTKGDEPFQALVARQIQIQPPGPVAPSTFAPLQGRKVLTFSDSRQVAARLAPNLQTYSTRDSLRPLIAWGYRQLQSVPPLQNSLNLEDLYLAVLLASKSLGVRLRPELKDGESFNAATIVEQAIQSGAAGTAAGLAELCLEIRGERPPEMLLENIVMTLLDRFRGFEALALAAIVEQRRRAPELHALPAIPGLADTPEAKVGLARVWLRCWQNNRFWLGSMPTVWGARKRSDGMSVRTQKGKFSAMERILEDGAVRKQFWKEWSPALLNIFTEETTQGHRRLLGNRLSLDFGDDWIHCDSCTSVHRSVPGIMRCLDCQSANVRQLDPNDDPVFLARKGFYRTPIVEALADPPRKPMALIAAEHTAQLNAPQNEDVFSKAEENELLFQDIKLGRQAARATAIDVLSSTTTMEVGIDLGALSGVALRNMPPGRANYQQRAGRAGRRGNAVATVVAFGSADSHDEHYFSEPDGMIRGHVVDPRLTLDNPDIVQRHIRAFLLQSYHQERLPNVDPQQHQDLFSVLGTVSDFRNGTSILNRNDFAAWLTKHQDHLRSRIASWIPGALSQSDRQKLLDEAIDDCLKAVDEAIRPSVEVAEADDETDSEAAPEEDSESPEAVSNSGKLLDRLLYCGKLPRYAFPTDVATFHIFDRDRSSSFRHLMRFSPSQGLPIALTQYAPGKQVWVSGKCYTSGAIYSVMSDDRFNAWQRKRIYAECSVCGFARTYPIEERARNEVSDCPACGAESLFGPARYWLRPPGFAHPIDVEEVTSPEDIPETSYATRAKLTMGTPDEKAGWHIVNDRIRALRTRQHLLVSNTGPKKEGYTYCTKCGRIEASTEAAPRLLGPHPKPYPDKDDALTCEGISPTRHIVLGTDFITDIALISMRVAPPLGLRPGHSSTIIALRTLSEALAKAACQMLEIEPSELMAEFRPALTPDGMAGLEAEIFLYDTLPGGAGFSAQLSARGEELFQRALQLLKSCPHGCDASCYRCLRSFKNKFEHSLLDRHVGAELAEYLLTGRVPAFDATRLYESTQLLHLDLERQAQDGFRFDRNASVTLNGKSEVVPILATDPSGRQFVIALSGPLTPDQPAQQSLSALSLGPSPLIVENELLVRGNLATATRRILQAVAR